MAHPIHKLIGPMLRKDPPATVEQVTDVLVTPVGLRFPRCIVDEWLNVARRRNGQPTTSQIIGQKFRTDQELRQRGKYLTTPPKKSLERLQRFARRITRLLGRS